MPVIKLRPATPKDLHFTYHVKKTSFREYVEQVWGWDEDAQLQLHQRRFGEQRVQIIRWEGKDVGFLSTEETTDCLKLNQLFLLPEYQGQGIGAECMRLLEETEQPIRLSVLKVNPRAAEFYLRLGYKETGETESHRLLEKEPASS
jgi:GNAT superfamily N-acetyltransferase